LFAIASVVDMEFVLSVDLRIVACMIANSWEIAGIENRYLYIIKILEMNEHFSTFLLFWWDYHVIWFKSLILWSESIIRYKSDIKLPENFSENYLKLS